MTFEVLIGDRLRTVTVVRKGALLDVTLDGRAHLVDARRVSETALSMLVQRDGHAMAVRSVDAAFASRNDGQLDVYLLGRAIAVDARPATRRGRRDAAGALKAAAGGPQQIVAPMPGKVVRVLVKAGDHVSAKQGLVVVEAMKMENELRAAREGRVRDVPAAEGQSVEAGAVLVVVD